MTAAKEEPVWPRPERVDTGAPGATAGSVCSSAGQADVMADEGPAAVGTARPRDGGREVHRAGVGIYVHVPFCVSKCAYCDFTSYPGLDELHGTYVDGLATELALAPRLRARTVYFGGGTPTVLGASRLAELLVAVRRRFDVAAEAEITCEANPDTIDIDSLAQLRAAGFNRLSIGVQSLDGDVLGVLGRTHDATAAVRAFESARQAGFDNINIDLIFGAPGESPTEWSRTLREAVRLGPDHMSVYSLTVEEGTRLSVTIEAGALPPLDEDVMADMMTMASEVLGQAGYERYEISNYARPGKQCRHNVDCWLHRDYLGFGVSAHSKIGGVRFSNHSAVDRYIASLLGRGIGAGDGGILGESECPADGSGSVCGGKQSHGDRARGAAARDFDDAASRHVGGSDVSHGGCAEQRHTGASSTEASQAGDAAHCDPVRLARMPQRIWSQSLSVRDTACEATILGLRLMGGMSRDRLDELWDGAGIDVGVALDQLRADGLLEAGDSVRLTDRGVALANEVFRTFV